METEELIKLIHLVGYESPKHRGEGISHPLIFLITVYESYQIAGKIPEPLKIGGDLGLINNGVCFPDMGCTFQSYYN